MCSWFPKVKHDRYADLYHHGIKYVYCSCGNILAGTFMLMKENFGIWECNTEPNTRYYPFSLWYGLNAELSHGQSQIRAWYSQGVEKNTVDDGNIRFRYRGENFLRQKFFRLITVCEKHAAKYIDDIAIFVILIWGPMIYYVVRRSPFTKLLILEGMILTYQYKNIESSYHCLNIAIKLFNIANNPFIRHFSECWYHSCMANLFYNNLQISFYLTLIRFMWK